MSTQHTFLSTVTNSRGWCPHTAYSSQHYHQYTIKCPHTPYSSQRYHQYTWLVSTRSIQFQVLLPIHKVGVHTYTVLSTITNTHGSCLHAAYSSQHYCQYTGSVFTHIQFSALITNTQSWCHSIQFSAPLPIHKDIVDTSVHFSALSPVLKVGVHTSCSSALITITQSQCLHTA